MVKHQYFCVLIVSSKCHSTALFKAPWIFLGKGGLEIYFQGNAEEFSVHLADKIAQIHFQWGAKHGAGQVLWRCLGRRLAHYLETI